MQKLYALKAIPPLLPPDADGVLLDVLSLANGSDDFSLDPRIMPMIETPDHPSSPSALAMALRHRPSIVVMRGMSAYAELQHLSSRLAVHEAEQGWDDGGIQIIAVLGDTPASLRTLTQTWPSIPRLAGLIFSPERLSGVLTDQPVDTAAAPSGDWPDPVRLARSLTLLAAKERGIPAYEWIGRPSDPKYAADRACRDGFTGTVVTL